MHGKTNQINRYNQHGVQVRLDHVAIAVDSPRLDELLKFFAELGLQSDHQESVPDQGVVTHFLKADAPEMNLELLEAVDPGGTVARFLKTRGPGIHHLSFEVITGGLDTLCEGLRQRGYRLVYDAARAGAHGMRINFVHPASAGGILVELSERKP